MTGDEIKESFDSKMNVPYTHLFAQIGWKLLNDRKNCKISNEDYIQISIALHNIETFGIQKGII